MRNIVDAIRQFAEVNLNDVKKEKQREDMLNDASKSLKKAKGNLEKVARQEKREITFDTRAKNLADALKQDIEKLEKEEPAKASAALKLVEDKLEVDMRQALAYGVGIETKIKNQIKYLGDIISMLDEIIKAKDWKRTSQIVSKIRGFYTNMQNLEKYLLAIIALDEEIKKLAVEAEAAEAH
jgi:hypothetical protein